MELPQSRTFGAEGKKPTHDFLSLYNHSSFQHQDPRPSQGIFLKTRDFLQPLETVGKSNSKGESIVETSPIEKPVVAQRPPSSSSSSSVEHILPGGIGTYTISHISNFNHQLVPKPEITSTTTTSCAVVPASSLEKKVDVNKTTISNSTSSYSGSSFSLWGDSVVEKATTKKAGNNNNGERHSIREPPAENLGHWSSEQQLQATITPPYIFRSSFSSLPSSKAMSKSQSFMEMMKSGKSLQEEDDDDEEFLGKKDISSQKELTVKVDGKVNDQKANTPRSKHSATEQRRRSKINDRFQILRDLIPLNDQKRDKASFLLEVIEYIQFLQDKVNKYEGPYQGWNQEPTKLMPWRNRPGESIADHSQAIQNGSSPGLMFAGKFNDHNVSITPPMLANAHNPVDNDRRTCPAYKPMDQNLGVVNKEISLPVPMQANMLVNAARSGDLAQPLQRPACDGESMISKSETHLWQNRSCATASGTLNEQDEMAIEGGTISISNVYSQGLLNNLTKALQSSGVDLSQASISVQIDLGKQPISRRTSTKDHENPSSSNRTLARSRDASSGDDSDHQAQKRLKTEKS